MQVVGNEAAGYPSGLKKYPHLRFMPRFGFAYRPFGNDKWAMRGGFGFYNINMLGSSFYSLTGTVQAQTQQFTNTYNPATHAIGYQWPQIYAGAGGAAGVGGYGTDYFGTANSTNWKDPYTEQWSLSVDHDLGSGYAARISYIGSETHQLVWAPDENTLPYSTTVSAYNAAHRCAALPQLGPHQHPRHRRQRELQLVAGGSQPSPAAWSGIQLRTLPGPKRWPTTRDQPARALAAKAAASAPPQSSTVMWTSAMSTEPAGCAGTRRCSMTFPLAAAKLMASTMPRAADLIVGGWRLSSILTLQTGPYETPYFPNGQGDPSGTGSGLNSTADRLGSRPPQPAC